MAAFVRQGPGRTTAMTYEYESAVDTRRSTSRGAKVMVFALSILAVLGAFWTVVWFIRSYVEQPRIAMRAPMNLASKESEPAPTLREPAAVAAMGTPVADPPPVKSLVQPVAARPKAAAPAAATPAAEPAPSSGQTPAADPAPASPVSDRWFLATPAAAPVPWPNDPPSSPAAANALAPTAPAPPADAPAATEPVEEDIVVSMSPAISGPIPKPRPKPPTHSVSARLRDAPLPRPRPEGAAPGSVWTAVPVNDDRFPTAPQPE